MNSLLYFSLKINNAMSGVLAYSVGQDLYRNNYILGKSTVLLNSTVETVFSSLSRQLLLHICRLISVLF